MPEREPFLACHLHGVRWCLSCHPDQKTGGVPDAPPPVDARKWLWDAINIYARSCGGLPDDHVYGNSMRQEAVVQIESAVAALAQGEPPTEPRDPPACDLCGLPAIVTHVDHVLKASLSYCPDCPDCTPTGH